MDKVFTFILGLVAATGAFWSTMLMKMPQTKAADHPGASLNISNIINHKRVGLAGPSSTF